METIDKIFWGLMTLGLTILGVAIVALAVRGGGC